MLHIYSHPEAAALGWETKGNKLTVSEGVVNGMQLPGEPHFTPVPSTFDVLIDVKTLVLISEVQKFVTIAATLQRVSDGMMNFRGFVTEPAQQERSDSDPEQDEEDVCLSTILHSIHECMYTTVLPCNCTCTRGGGGECELLCPVLSCTLLEHTNVSSKEGCVPK